MFLQGFRLERAAADLTFYFPVLPDVDRSMDMGLVVLQGLRVKELAAKVTSHAKHLPVFLRDPPMRAAVVLNQQRRGYHLMAQQALRHVLNLSLFRGVLVHHVPLHRACMEQLSTNLASSFYSVKVELMNLQ